jgi:Lon protease-like protein
MQDELLPLFPLQVVLFPQTPLPLHIFEERYKEMMSELIATGGEFGVVLAQGKGILRVGCTASIENIVKRYDDGRLDLLTVGRERFQIEEVDTGRSYFRGRVRYFDDTDFSLPDPALRRRGILANAEYRSLAEIEDEPDLEDERLSFQLCSVSPDLGFRQTLLAIRSEAQRMPLVVEHLEKLIQRHKQKEQLRRVARTNGLTNHRFPLDEMDA